MKIKTIQCIDCGITCERTGSNQKRCPRCRKINKLEKYRKKVKEFSKKGLNYNKENYKKNKESIKKSLRRYYLRTRGQLRLGALQTIADNKSIQCAKHKDWCCCGNSSNLDYLELDHIKNDGAIDRKKFSKGNTFYRWIIDNPEKARKKLQILCSNAQWIKRRIQEARKRKE